MHLMMTLRETEASRWTERDTPIFVGKLVDVRTALDALDGAVTEPARRASTRPPTARATPRPRLGRNRRLWLRPEPQPQP